ncbi:MAG TPA: hypothetical protein VJ483_00335 [Holophagaceae bacterium]|nr:hypothetical protein [Holophagaceae bacterium]
MNQKRLTSSLVLGLALAAGSLTARPSPQKSAAEADKKEVACVVCGKKVAKADAIKVTVQGQQHFVCSDACARELSANPGKYVKEGESKKP